MRDCAENDGERIRIGESITKALKALRDQEEYELRTLREEDLVGVARDLQDAVCSTLRRYVKKEEHASKIITEAFDLFKERVEERKRSKRSG